MRKRAIDMAPRHRRSHHPNSVVGVFASGSRVEKKKKKSRKGEEREREREREAKDVWSLDAFRALGPCTFVTRSCAYIEVT